MQNVPPLFPIKSDPKDANLGRKDLRNHNGYTYKLFKNNPSILRKIFILWSSNSYIMLFFLYTVKNIIMK